MIRIAFSHTGRQLSTRVAGAALREKIIEGIENDQKIIFDFAGVDIVSNSFADECFAKLMLHFDLPVVKEHTTFQNASPFIKAVIANSFKERLQAMHTH
ncbi:STAS-like domain-containing protein [Mucilaginibacter sp. KACC 22773]|uniref:STAS-like domain-containing protein n=1 Tax=Mucilaginibacter sp. KACC 22773 TaxID=3025671 RepID=UPI002365F68F|nr:STAS-like domain-containing protein [Mucilaginibacter sp. KACC 22773]WDF77124.1 STAS-like domain-containing protein [Mucilaginibacter sp. KACC 22773]